MSFFNLKYLKNVLTKWLIFSPHGARVSGVVEETPGHLEYEVALYKEAPARISSNATSELPVDQAVPIGTKLQLRARINPDSGTTNFKSLRLSITIPISSIGYNHFQLGNMSN